MRMGKLKSHWPLPYVSSPAVTPAFPAIKSLSPGATAFTANVGVDIYHVRIVQPVRRLSSPTQTPLSLSATPTIPFSPFKPELLPIPNSCFQILEKSKP